MSALREQSATLAAPRRNLSPAALLLAWLPVGIWMACIVSLSSDRFSDENTAAWLSAVIGGLGVPPTMLQAGNWMLRKSAHFVEYAVLGMLTFRAFRLTWPPQRVRQLVLAAVAASALFAGLDELRQYAVTTHREGRPADVVVDVTGAAAGAVILSRRARGGIA